MKKYIANIVGASIARPIFVEITLKTQKKQGIYQKMSLLLTQILNSL